MASAWIERMRPLEPMAASSVPLSSAAAAAEADPIDRDHTEVLAGRLYLCGLLRGELYRAVRAHTRPGQHFTVLALLCAGDLLSRRDGMPLDGPLRAQVITAVRASTPRAWDPTYVDTDAAEAYAVGRLTGSGSAEGTRALLADLLECNTQRAREDFTLVHVPVRDRTRASVDTLREHLPALVRAMHTAIAHRRDEPLFVHCQLGVSRSATLVVAYLASCGALAVRRPVSRSDACGLVSGAIDYVRAVRPFASVWDGTNDEDTGGGGGGGGAAAPAGGFVGLLVDALCSEEWAHEVLTYMAGTRDGADNLANWFSHYVVMNVPPPLSPSPPSPVPAHEWIVDVPEERTRA